MLEKYLQLKDLVAGFEQNLGLIHVGILQTSTAGYYHQHGTFKLKNLTLSPFHEFEKASSYLAVLADPLNCKALKSALLKLEARLAAGECK